MKLSGLVRESLVIARGRLWMGQPRQSILPGFFALLQTSEDL